MVNILCVSYDIQVSGLQAGQTYRFRVSAVNEAGVSCASLPTEPVTAQTQPGQLSWLQVFKHCNTKKKNHLQGLLLVLELKYSIKIIGKASTQFSLCNGYLLKHVFDHAPSLSIFINTNKA